MGRFVKGQVVVVLFPFSDLSDTKKRPALVVKALQGEDCILCQITSNQHSDANAIALLQADFVQGKLSRPSFVRPNRIFTASEQLIAYAVGTVSVRKMREVMDALVKLLSED